MGFAELIDTLNTLPPEKQAEIIDFAEFVAKKHQQASLSKNLAEQDRLVTALTTKVERRPKYQLSELLAEMPETLPMVEGWDDMPSVGLEKS